MTRAGVFEDDDTPKQLHVICPPRVGGPQLLLAFTGLAEMPDGTPTLRWVKETLRGETRTIMQTLEHLRDRLTRDVGASRLWKEQLVFSGGIFEGDKRFYVEIRNLRPSDRRVTRQFEFVVVEVTEPWWFIGGSGLRWVSPKDHELLSQQVLIRPAKWDDHLGLLAGINRRTAARDPTDMVSPWCHGTFLSLDRKGGRSRTFRKPGEPEQEAPACETLIMGIDMSEISALVMQQVKKMQDVGPGSESDADPSLSDASRRAVEGRP